MKGNWRMEWTSLPTPFISAQRITELPLPCVTVCHHITTRLYHSLSAQRLTELPLPCVTVCHHISTRLYHSLSAQRLSERTVLGPIGVCMLHTATYRHQQDLIYAATLYHISKTQS